MPLYRTLRVRDILSAAEALNNRWDRALALTRLDTLGIPLRRRAGKLSGGQQAQVALTWPSPAVRSCCCSTSRWPAWIRSPGRTSWAG